MTPGAAFDHASVWLSVADPKAPWTGFDAWAAGRGLSETDAREVKVMTMMFRDALTLLKQALRTRNLTDLRILWVMTSWRLIYYAAPLWRAGRAARGLMLRCLCAVVWWLLRIERFTLNRAEEAVGATRQFDGLRDYARAEARRILALCPDAAAKSDQYAFAYHTARIAQQEADVESKRAERWTAATRALHTVIMFGLRCAGVHAG